MVKGLRNRDLLERTLGKDCVCLTYWGRNGSAEVQVCNTGMVWWSLATTSAPGSSAQFSISSRTNSD